MKRLIFITIAMSVLCMVTAHADLGVWTDSTDDYYGYLNLGGLESYWYKGNNVFYYDDTDNYITFTTRKETAIWLQFKTDWTIGSLNWIDPINWLKITNTGYASGNKIYLYDPLYNTIQKSSTIGDDFLIKIKLYKWWWFTYHLVEDKTYSFIKDSNPPTLTLNPPLDDEWHDSVTLTLLADDGDGSGVSWGSVNWSGLFRPGTYSVSKDGGDFIRITENGSSIHFPDDNTLLMIITEEGLHTYDFRVEDRLGHISAVLNCVTKIDRTPPDPPAAVIPTITTAVQDGKTVLDKIRVQWSQVTTDNPPGEDNHSGFAGYKYGFIPAEAYQMQGADAINAATDDLYAGTGVALDFSRFQRGREYVFAARSVDIAGNKSEWTVSEPMFIPPEAFEIDSAASAAAIMDDGDGNSVPAYHVSVSFRENATSLFQSDGVTPAINALELECRDASGNLVMSTGSMTVATIIDQLGPLSSTWKTEGGRLVYSFTLTGAAHAHKNYTYTIRTHYNFENVYEDGGNPLSALIPNIEPEFFVRIKDGDGNIIGEVDADGYVRGTSTPFYHYTNEPLHLSVVMPNANGTDAEGDIVKYLLYSIEGFIIGDGQPASSKTAGHQVLFSTDGSIYHCYLGIDEHHIEEDNSETSLSAVYSDYRPMKTLHKVGPLSLEGFYLYFDDVAANGAFQLRSRDDGRIFSMSEPTNTADVELFIAQRALTDKMGSFIESGIASVTAWNLSIPSSAQYPLNIAQLIADNPPASAQALTFDSNDAEAPLEDFSINWRIKEAFSGSSNGECLVIMKIVDGAGNEFITHQIVRLDTIPPAAPDTAGFNHSYSEDGSTLSVWWSGSHDSVSYTVTFTDPAGAPQTRTTALPGISIAGASAYAPNSPIPLTVYATDLAGNNSTVVTYTAYALPQLGTITLVEKGHNSVDGNFMRWSVSGGIAARHAVEILSSDGSLVRSIDFQAGGECLLSGILPHRTIHYRLAAFNVSGDKVTGGMLTETLPNNPPTAPEGLAPTGFINGRTKISWHPADDADNDALTYHVYLKKESESGFTLLGGTTGTSYPPGNDSLDLENETVYEYKIAADDTPADGSFAGTVTESASASVQVDNIAPHITFGLPDPADPADNTLTVMITDNYSDIDTVNNQPVYWTSENGVQQALNLAPAGGRSYTAEIPLDPNAEYSVFVRVYDRAGNETRRETSTLLQDATPPVINTAAIALDQRADMTYVTSRDIPVMLGLSDDRSGVKGIRYAFTETAGGEASGWQTIILEPVQKKIPENAVVTYSRTLIPGVSDGETRYLAIKAFDWSGNDSAEWRSAQPILTDGSAPVLTVTAGGIHSAFGNRYIQSVSSLQITAEAAEHESAPVRIEYAIVPADTTPEDITWYPTLAGAKGLSTENGKSYLAFVRAVNGIGLSSTWNSGALILDATAPVNLTLVNVPVDEVTLRESVRITANAVDDESPVTTYRITIGTETDPALVSRLIDGNIGGWLVLENPSKPDFEFSIPEVASGTYGFRYEAVNASGLSSTLVNAGIIRVNTTLAKLIITTPGMYSTSKDTLSAHWTYTGPDTVTGYRYRIIDANGTAVASWVNTTDGSATPTIANLQNGAAYAFDVQALFDDGGMLQAQSRPILVDFTPPVFGENGLVTPEFSQSKDLWITYGVDDPESGIGAIQVNLESYNAPGELVSVSNGWIPLQTGKNNSRLRLLTDSLGAPLQLSSGQRLYMTLRVTNKAGAIIDRKAPVVIIDDTAPPSPIVLDQGRAVNTAQYIKGSWIWTPEDIESGPATYEWTVTQTPHDTSEAAWIADDGTHTADVASDFTGTFSRIHGQTWYFVVKATNGAGLVSYGASDGITYDSSAPFIADAVFRKGEQEAFYIEDFTNANLAVTAFEDISEINRYEAIYGKLNMHGEIEYGLEPEQYASAASPVDVSDPAPEASSGEVLIHNVNAVNKTGLVSEEGFTKGVMVSGAAPAVLMINAAFTGTSIEADWLVDTSGVPIKQYYVRLRSAGSTTNIMERTTTGPRIRLDAAALSDGQYIVQVNAVNMADAESGYTTSGVFYVDQTPPAITRCDTPDFAAESVSLYCEADDAQSGIREYVYALGTFEDADAFTGGWKSIVTTAGALDTTVLFNELSSGFDGVIDGTSIYIRVRAKNGAGIWSAERVSAPIVIDKSPPSRPVVVVTPPYTRYANLITVSTLQSADPESRIQRIAYALTADTAPETLEAAVWTEKVLSAPVPQLSETDYEISGLSLPDAASVFVSIRVQNGAGLWSGITSSARIRVDLSAPVVAFGTGDEVINEPPHTVAYTVNDATSDSAVVHIWVLDAKGDIADEITNLTVTTNSAQHYVLNQTVLQTYTLQIQATDIAGNVSEKVEKTIRINQPAIVTMTSIATTPGKPLDLSEYVQVVDPDGEITSAMFLWSFGDGSGDETAHSPTHPYFQETQYAQVSEYTLTLTVTDVDGKVTTGTAAVTVENTKEGRLYTDEYWQGNHRMQGNILVPGGATLTVMAGTSVECIRNPLTGGVNHRITVNGNFIAETGSRFAVAAGIPGTWNGILVYGTADIQGAVFSQADRALTAGVGSHMTLSGAEFESNKIGIHVLQTLTINGCIFTRNGQYAIKEEQARPVVLNCIFEGNAYDYYHTEQTVLNAAQVNDIDGNSGNTNR